MIGALAVTLFFASLQPPPVDPDLAVVKAQFPSELAAAEARYIEDDVPTRRDFRHIASPNGDGSRRIFAAYSNGHECAVRIIDVDREGVVAAGPAAVAEEFGGEQAPVLQLRDVTGDGRAEVIATIPGPPFQTTWIFGVAGRQLVSLNPVEEGKPLAFGELTFVDVDGDRVAEVIQRAVAYFVDAPDGPTRREVWDRFDFDDSQYRLSDECIVYVARFSSARSDPEPVQVEFDAVRDANVDVLVLNGGLGSGRVSTATVKLNGETIITSSNVNAGIRSTTVAAKVRGTSRPRINIDESAEPACGDIASEANVLDVTVGGVPGSQITLLFRCVGK